MGRIADRFLARHPELLDDDRTSPRAARAIAALTAPLAAWCRFRVDGLERVPDGGCLVVANHSAGAVPEILLLHRAWRRRFGDRPVRGLAHQIAYQPPLKWLPIAQAIGGVYAHPTVAKRVLERGEPLLVFPGGDVEVMRPFSRRYRVVFDGRTGFVRLAREAGVPIVPLVFCGSHAAYLVPPGARALARVTAMERVFGLHVLPLTVGVVAALAASIATIAVPPLWPLALAAWAQAFVPAPTRIQAEVLPPMQLRADESDAAAAARVQAAMQEAMDRMAGRRRTPWF